MHPNRSVNVWTEDARDSAHQPVIFTRAAACSGHTSYDGAGTGSVRPLPAPGRLPGIRDIDTAVFQPDHEQFPTSGISP